MNLRPIKRLGQHFLVDPNTIRRIIAQLEAPEDATVVEIGPGRGALTEYLIERHPRFVAVEVDGRAVEYLRARFPELDVRHEDVLDLDYETVLTEKGQDGRLWIVGNLPYNITSQILFGLLETDCVARAVLTMQREVAERLVAKPRTKAYGILSVMTQLLTTPRVCFHISPNVFRPKPDVWSSTVRLDWEVNGPSRDELDVPELKNVVRAAFNQRRKTLRNSLAGITADAGTEIPEKWAMKRAEELYPGEFVDLTRAIRR